MFFCFFHYFRFRTPQKGGSRLDRVTISEKDNSFQSFLQDRFYIFCHPYNHISLGTPKTLEAPNVLYFADKNRHSLKQ